MKRANLVHSAIDQPSEGIRLTVSRRALLKGGAAGVVALSLPSCDGRLFGWIDLVRRVFAIEELIEGTLNLDGGGSGMREARIVFEVRRVVDVVENELEEHELTAILGQEVFATAEMLYDLASGASVFGLPQLWVALALARAVIVIYTDGEIIGHSLGFEVLE